MYTDHSGTPSDNGPLLRHLECTSGAFPTCTLKVGERDENTQGLDTPYGSTQSAYWSELCSLKPWALVQNQPPPITLSYWCPQCLLTVLDLHSKICPQLLCNSSEAPSHLCTAHLLQRSSFLWPLGSGPVGNYNPIRQVYNVMSYLVRSTTLYRLPLGLMRR